MGEELKGCCDGSNAGATQQQRKSSSTAAAHQQYSSSTSTVKHEKHSSSSATAEVPKMQQSCRLQGSCSPVIVTVWLEEKKELVRRREKELLRRLVQSERQALARSATFLVIH